MLVKAALRLILCVVVVNLSLIAKGDTTPETATRAKATSQTIRTLGNITPALKSDKATTGTAVRQPIAPRIRPGYTSRSLMIVGTVKSIDSATSTVVVTIDRKKSSLPHILLLNARKAGIEDEVIAREMPKERAYKLNRRTMFLDARPDPTKKQVKAETGQIKTDPRFIKFTDFKEGEWVSVLYRMRSTPTKSPIVFNVSKVDPEKTNFNVDFSPMGKKRQFKRPIRSTNPDPKAKDKKKTDQGNTTP